MELYNGSEKLGVISKRYRLSRFAGELTKVPDPATDAIHQMQDALAGILHSISKETARTANAVENQEL